jgi:hypothetical protein
LCQAIGDATPKRAERAQDHDRARG